MKKEKILKLLTFLIITMVTISCFFVFREYVVLNGCSFESIFVIIIMLWTASLYNDKDYVISSNLATNLKESERILLGKHIASANIYLAALLIPTIFFFKSWVKISLPILLVFLAMLIGILSFRIKYSKQIKERIEKEEQELKQQIENEAQGKIWITFTY